MASIVNVTLVQGDDTSRTWALTSNASPLNLSGATVEAVIKPSPSVDDDATTGVHTLTEGDGLTITNPTQGQVELEIPTEVTESPGQWYYKIRVTLAGDTETAVWGWIAITDS